MRSILPTVCLASMGVVVACGRGGEPAVVQEVVVPEAPQPEPLPLRVEFAGCQGGERQANTCILGSDRALTVWVEGKVAASLSTGGVPLVGTEAIEVDGGWRRTVQLPADATSIEATREDAVGWSMTIVQPPATPVLARIEAMLPDQNAVGRTPKIKLALAEIDRSLPTMGAYEKVLALRLATVLAWDGAGDEVAWGRRALTAALELGDPTLVVTVAHLLLHMLGDDPETNWVIDLEGLYAANVADAVWRYHWQRDRGIHALDSDDVGDGIEALEVCEALARRVGLLEEEIEAVGSRVQYLANYGRPDDARDAAQRMLAILVDGARLPCDHLPALVNAASSMLESTRPGRDAHDVDVLLERALRAFDDPQNGCVVGDNQDLQDTHALARNQYVVAAERRGDWDEAERRIAWFEEHPVSAYVASDIAVARAELAFARGDLEQVRTVLATIPARSPDRRIDWRAAELRGRAERAAGNTVAALRAFFAAEAILDAMIADLGADQGREGVGVGLYASAAGAIEILTAGGRFDEAVGVARHSRARALRPVGRAASIAELAETDRVRWNEALVEYATARDQLARELTGAWALPTDQREVLQRGHAELRAKMRDAHNRALGALGGDDVPRVDLALPGPGELWIIVHPATTGWFVLATGVDGTVVHRLDALPVVADVETGAALLEPLTRQVESAHLVKVLAVGDALEIPFHLLPFGDGLLVDHVAVAWGLDAGSRPTVAKRTKGLVVADPASRGVDRGSLPRAREEGAAVAVALRSRGLAITELVGDAATAADVLAAMQGVDWLHYAGHGVTAGRFGWDAALPLAGEASLGVRDVLAIGSAPRAVVLSGCGTAAVVPGTTSGGVSMATAFILAGAEFVIGAASDLGDEDAVDMARTLYASDLAAPGPDVFRAATRDGAARARPWATALRVWIP